MLIVWAGIKFLSSNTGGCIVLSMHVSPLVLSRKTCAAVLLWRRDLKKKEKHFFSFFECHASFPQQQLINSPLSLLHLSVFIRRKNDWHVLIGKELKLWIYEESWHGSRMVKWLWVVEKNCPPSCKNEEPSFHPARKERSVSSPENRCQWNDLTKFDRAPGKTGNHRSTVN